MKYVLVILTLILSINTAQSQDDSAKWMTDFEKAKKLSVKKDMPILMYFTGSDWCKPCIQLKADYFDTQEFQENSKGMILVVVDRPYRLDIISEEQMARNKVLIEKYNKQGSYPLLLVLDKKGKVKDEISGYSGDPKFYNDFVKRNS